MSLFGEKTKLVGTLRRVFFRADSGFAVGQFQVAGSGERVAVRGVLGHVTEGLTVELSGQFEDHPRYGRQFAVDTVEVERPEGKGAIQAYLASGLVKGIGPALAGRIVKALGETTLEVIERDPEQLLRVPGIGRKKALEIQHAIQSQASLREVMLFLHGHGLPAGLAHKILEAYGNEAPRLLKNNPYRLADDLVGVGFKRADEVAAKLGVPGDSEERRQAGLLHTLGQAVGRDGHCCLPRTELLERAADVLGQNPADLEQPLAALAEQRRVMLETMSAAAAEPLVYPLTMHVAETGLARVLRMLRGAEVPLLVKDPDAAIGQFEESTGFVMPESQRAALRTALRSPLCVITGGPGVGKTTIIRALTTIVEATGRTVALAAPTGRAAKRLSEATGRPASTIHRLLEYQPGTHRFSRNEHNPLEADLVVVDETSMLDLPLAYNLCRAVPGRCHVVWVGDVDQLPSVGPGRVLDDLIRSGCVEVVRLTEIFRQQSGSRIITNAHRILAGDLPDVPPAGAELSDFYFVEQSDSERCLEMVVRLVTDRIPNAFGLDPITDVQVLCPMYRGPLGVDGINDRLGSVLVPGGPELLRGARRFRPGDKVLQVRNNYDLDLFNGDPGRVTAVRVEEKKLEVRFSTKRVELAGEELDQIVPAYGITVHRAQGSEYPAVIMTLDTAHHLLLNRRLLYTAVTRAKRLLVLVGSRAALERAVRTDEEGTRFTGLQTRLVAAGPVLNS